jgi:hypothetical protein
MLETMQDMRKMILSMHTVAQAEVFDATLLTMDERFARAHFPTCRIEVLGAT